MARIYANENFPFPVVVAWRQLGHDVLTSLDAGQFDRAIPDEAVLEFAIAEGRVLLTLNRKHFIRLHRVSSDHSGIIVCTFDPDFQALAVRVDAALAGQVSLEGQLLRVNRPARPA